MPDRQLFGEDGRFLAGVTVCDTVRSRARGLLGQRHLPVDQCVLLQPCRSVHTVGMKMPIDVAALDRHLRVVAMATHLPPGRLFARRMARTRSILEAAAGAFATWRLVEGEGLSLRDTAGDPT